MAPPLRIAQVVRPAAGGIRRHVSQIVAGLDRSAFAPTLFAPPGFALEPGTPETQQIALDIAPRTAPLSDLRALFRLTGLLRGSFDLVHAHGLRAALIAIPAARRAGVPALFTSHNLLPAPGALQRRILQRIGQSSARILAVSEAVAVTLREAGLPPDRIEIVSNGIDLASLDRPSDPIAARARYGVAADTPLVVGVGRLSPEKGFDILIEAMPFCRRSVPGAHLLLAGSGPEEDRLKALAVESPGVQLLGRLDEIAPLLAAADVVAIPSRQEGQGIVALEAMAARRPVVATCVGGLVETIQEGETGLLVPAEDPRSFGEALAALLADPHRRRRMGEAGRARVTPYTLERMIQRLETLYQEIAARR